MLPSWLPDTITTDLDRLISRALLWGLEGIELRTIGKRSERVPFVNEAVLRRRFESCDLKIVSVCPDLFGGKSTDRAGWMNDLIMLDESIAFCLRVHCPMIVVPLFADDRPDELDAVQVVEVLRRAGERVSRSGIRLAVQPSGGTDAVRKADAWLQVVGNPSIGLVWNPITVQNYTEGPAGLAGDIIDRLMLVRYVSEPAQSSAGPIEEHAERPVDWPGLLAFLAGSAYEGPLSLVLPEDTSSRDGLMMATELVTLVRNAERNLHPRNA